MTNPMEIKKQFLEKNQYSEHGIKAYEFIFGKDFISSGGLESTIKILENVKLNENSKVLDIGSGIGGGCKYINEKYNSFTHGIDISENMVQIAINRNKGNPKIVFEAADVLTKDFPENTFDMIYSRDSILHLDIQSKKKLFEKCYKWLKPNGILLITDYCANNEENWDDEFKNYVKHRKYSLTTIDEYKSLIESSYFKNVVSKDITSEWTCILEKEMKHLQESRDYFIQEFSEEKYNYFIKLWARKIRDSKRGLQLWGFFEAKKI